MPLPTVQLYVEAEIATGEDGNERSIECLSLIDAACYDVVRKGGASSGAAAGAASAPVAGSSIGPLDGSGYGLIYEQNCIDSML